MASLALTCTADEMATFVKSLGEEKILDLSVLIGEFGKSRLKYILTDKSD